MKGYILVEGEGELGAAENLITRLWHEAGHWQHWARAITCKSTHQRKGIEKGIGLVRAKRDAGALLILRDEDDACPRERGPQMASWVRELDPPFPVAVVLMCREYEVLFLPCVELMAGRPLIGPDGQERPGLLPGTRWEHSDDWERTRDIKGWLSDHFPPGRVYKPTVDQWPMTRMIDVPTLRAAGVPCFGTLERALAFLASSFGGAGVYPPPGG
ncbi:MULTISPECIES: DUF4276 family protein [Sorangium]|uniref:DUF4276 family protein n=1 Tax=Sorangium cellulosum TaxID=56 RepID=A0A4P2R4Q1_SORCE|nr:MULTISPECIES: DUF4276 family protein [Sorangium]AUX37746.1 hypothetical protein SOCE836_099770 [Sorangium cellulosum]WCQ97033.1 hypothetical protein NQZ70_09824 [Sorangium sp. Soce836]